MENAGGGGSPVRVTTKGGVYGIESKDGRFLYYAKFGECRVTGKKPWRRGEESRLPINVCKWYDWDLTRDGIYFQNPDFPPNGQIEYLRFCSWPDHTDPGSGQAMLLS